MPENALEQLVDPEAKQEEADQKLDDMMPPKPEAMNNNAISIEQGEMSKQEIEKKTNGFPEVKGGKYPDVVQDAKRTLGKKPNQGSTTEITTENGDHFIVLYDNKKGFRVFKNKDKNQEAVAANEKAVNAEVEAAFDGQDYKHLKNPKGRDKSALKYAKSQIGDDDIYIVEDGDTTYVYQNGGSFYKSK